MSRSLSASQVWGVPTALGLLSLVGLVAALVSDGTGDVLSWVALAVPAVVSAWGLLRRSESGTRTPAPPVPERRAVRPAGPPPAGGRRPPSRG